jgi:hypothetical protein
MKKIMLKLTMIVLGLCLSFATNAATNDDIRRVCQEKNLQLVRIIDEDAGIIEVALNDLIHGIVSECNTGDLEIVNDFSEDLEIVNEGTDILELVSVRIICIYNLN